MQRSSERGRPQVELQAMYSLPALAEFARMNRHKLRRLLERTGVRFLRAGRALFIPLSEVKDKIPPLWKSMCALEEARVKALERARAEQEAGRRERR